MRETRPLPGPVIAGDPQKVVSADQDEREDQAGGASATSRTDSDRHAQQRKDKAGGGKREAVVQARRGRRASRGR